MIGPYTEFQNAVGRGFVPSLAGLGRSGSAPGADMLSEHLGGRRQVDGSRACRRQGSLDDNRARLVCPRPLGASARARAALRRRRMAPSGLTSIGPRKGVRNGRPGPHFGVFSEKEKMSTPEGVIPSVATKKEPLGGVVLQRVIFDSGQDPFWHSAAPNISKGAHGWSVAPSDATARKAIWACLVIVKVGDHAAVFRASRDESVAPRWAHTGRRCRSLGTGGGNR